MQFQLHMSSRILFSIQEDVDSQRPNKHVLMAAIKISGQFCKNKPLFYPLFTFAADNLAKSSKTWLRTKIFEVFVFASYLFFCAKLSTESLDKKVFLFYYLVIVKHAYLILWSSAKLNFKVITNLFSTLLSHLLAHYVKLAQKSQTSFYSHVTCQSRASFSFLLALESLLRRSIEVCNKAKDLKKAIILFTKRPLGTHKWFLFRQTKKSKEKKLSQKVGKGHNNKRCFEGMLSIFIIEWNVSEEGFNSYEPRKESLSLSVENSEWSICIKALKLEMLRLLRT